MESNWLAVSSLQRSYKVISAINTLSIYAKLQIGGVQDGVNQTDLAEARQTLRSFLERLEPIVDGLERTSDETILGTDPRLRELAQLFVKERQTRPVQSGLQNITLEELSHLLHTERVDELQLLVDQLRALRGLVEQHVRGDIVHIFGDV